MWDERPATWHDHVVTSPAFDHVRSEVLATSRAASTDRVVDLGAGTGFLTLPLAREAADVMAVDLSPHMLEALSHEVQRAGLDNIRVVEADLVDFELEASSVDLVVSSYALHHLSQSDKRRLIHHARAWLRPGGRIVIADMMFGRGGTARDRAVIRSKVSALVRKGPGGVWRVAKNLVRFGLRSGTELPASPQFWTTLLAEAGFDDVRFDAVVAEAGIVSGSVPAV